MYVPRQLNYLHFRVFDIYKSSKSTFAIVAPPPTFFFAPLNLSMMRSQHKVIITCADYFIYTTTHTHTYERTNATTVLICFSYFRIQLPPHLISWLTATTSRGWQFPLPISDVPRTLKHGARRMLWKRSKGWKKQAAVVPLKTTDESVRFNAGWRSRRGQLGNCMCQPPLQDADKSRFVLRRQWRGKVIAENTWTRALQPNPRVFWDLRFHARAFKYHLLTWKLWGKKTITVCSGILAVQHPQFHLFVDFFPPQNYSFYILGGASPNLNLKKKNNNKNYKSYI